MFLLMCAVLGRPLPALRSAKSVSLGCFKKSFSVVFLQPFIGNSCINLLAPYPFDIKIFGQNRIFFSQTVMHSAYLQTAVVCYDAAVAMETAQVALDPNQTFKRKQSAIKC